MINEKKNNPPQSDEKRTAHPYWVWESIQMIPTVLQQCLGEQVTKQADSIADEIRKRKIEKFVLLGTGSSYFATIAEKYFFDAMTSFWSFPYVSSVFKSYPPKFLDEKTAVFFHSHSGKTEGDDAVVEFSQSKDAFTVGVTDIENSPLASVVDQVFIGPGGPKHEMPASRTYATALFRMMLLGLKLSTIAENTEAWQTLDNSMKRMPAQVGEFMRKYETAAGENVNHLKDVTSFFCIGSGPNLSTADECALALSQCAGVPSQSFEADNFVHGPLQTLKKSMGLVGIAAPGPLQDRILKISKAAQVIGAKVVLVLPEGTDCGFDPDVRIEMPADIPELLSPVFYMVPLWQTAYHFGLLGNGLHPDRLSMDKPEFIAAFSNLMYKDKWVTNK